MASQIFVSVMAKVTPVASASMLVATASGSMVLKPKESFSFSSSWLSASRIIFAPIRTSSTQAIQWSKRLMYSAKELASRNPSSGINA